MASQDGFDPRILFAEKERLSELPYFSRDQVAFEPGVLLSDKIEELCTDFKLIDPFTIDSLRPAGYDLRVGLNYAIRENRQALSLGETLTIEPYQVAVIQTLETLNLPDFLIGRWNIRVKLAYSGLLWVGGAQVDPGFRGRLSCPIYNLSTKPVKLACGDRLAMIDFVTTTTFLPGSSRAFQWWANKSLIFQQYATDLCSGVEDTLDNVRKEVNKNHSELALTVKQESEKLRQSLAQSQVRIDTRIDTFLTLVFTVVAVLFAGLGIVATKGSEDSSFVSSPVWVAAVALYFALKPYAIAWSESIRNVVSSGPPADRGDSERGWIRMLKPNFIEILAGTIIVAGSIAFNVVHAHISAQTIADQGNQIQAMRQSLTQQKYALDLEIRTVQAQSDAKIQSLQTELASEKRK